MQKKNGPWKVRGLGVYEGDERVADCASARDAIRIGRLCANSTTLLEALEKLCGYQEQLCDYEQDPPSDEVETNVWTAARNAIRSARGDD